MSRHALTNWAGNYTYGARTVHRPTTREQVQEIVCGATRLRVLGSRHSFTGISDSDELLALDALPADVSFDRNANTVSFNPAIRYGELAAILAPAGMAVANLASLPHISVAGALATGTHGSGDANGILASSVAAVEIVTADGEVLRASRGEDLFNGLVVGLGALGVLTRVTLDLEPAFNVRQRVFEGLRWEALFEHFDEITAAAYSVSVFTRWGGATDQVWLKTRVSDTREREREDLFGAVSATLERHPILGLDPVNCTPQLGVPGLWSERLPHFRLGFTPSSGAEIQSEFLVPRASAAPAIEAVRGLAARIGPLVLVSEIRTIGPDELWMSPAYGRATVAIHFTWRPDQEAVQRALHEVEAALAPFDARPHWGKLFLADASAIAPLYEHHGDFCELVQRTDPCGVFTNRWLERCVLVGR